MTINRFNTMAFSKSDWIPAEQIDEIDMILEFPGEFSALAPVVREIAQLAEGASATGEGKLDNAGLSQLGHLFEKAANLTDGDNAESLMLKAKALKNGYSEDIIRALNALNEDLSFVGGNVSSWYGKRPGGFATCFATQTNHALNKICADVDCFAPALTEYLATINKSLQIREVPKYMVCDLVFMAGEGAGHPKHIAYFLPEDEGFKNSPIKKTHYFSNVHLEQMEKISADLLTRHGNVSYRDADIKALGALGVLSHEYGHFIALPETDFRQASKWNRWSSIMYQEIAADVFGFLILAEVWGPLLGHTAEQCCAYYLGELLRYVNRGFGRFPDSDGMMFQLNYLREFSAIEEFEGQNRLCMKDPQLVLAAMRSLARSLTECLLKNDCSLLADFDERYGVHSPATEQLAPFLQALDSRQTPSLNYRINGL